MDINKLPVWLCTLIVFGFLIGMLLVVHVQFGNVALPISLS